MTHCGIVPINPTPPYPSRHPPSPGSPWVDQADLPPTGLAPRRSLVIGLQDRVIELVYVLAILLRFCPYGPYGIAVFAGARFFPLPLPPPQRLEPHPLNAIPTFPFLVDIYSSPPPFPIPSPSFLLLLAFSDFSLKHKRRHSAASVFPNPQYS